MHVPDAKHKMKLKNPKYLAILILFSVSLVFSALIAFIPLPTLCGPGQGCSIVQNSSYARTLGIDNSYFGVGIFAIMVAATAIYLKKPSDKRRLFIDFGVLLGTLVSVRFLYLQQFVLHAYCKYCLVVDFSMVLAFIVMIIPFRKKGGSPLNSPASASPATPQAPANPAPEKPAAAAHPEQPATLNASPQPILAPSAAQASPEESKNAA